MKPDDPSDRDTPPSPRFPRVPSAHDLEDAAYRGARQAFDDRPQSSTPPTWRWLERRSGRLFLRALGAAAVSVAAGAGGWLWRDCQALAEKAATLQEQQGRGAQPAPSKGSP